MDQLLDYLAHHPVLVALTGLAAAVALGYEAWLRAQSAGGLPPQDVIRLMNQGATVLDLRQAEEFAAGHISGARHFDPAQLGNATEALRKYKERPLIVYCDRGATAAGAARQLVRQGFKTVFNLRGGLAAWRAENLPLARG